MSPPAAGAAALPSWSSAAHGIAAGGSSAKNGKPFTLYKLPATTGFSYGSGASAHKYNQLCRAVGLLPIGCGTSLYDCDAHRYFGTAECIPMPAAWGCYFDAALSSATGFRSIVAFENNGDCCNSAYVYGANAVGAAYRPAAGDALHPVCGKMGPLSEH